MKKKPPKLGGFLHVPRMKWSYTISQLDVIEAGKDYQLSPSETRLNELIAVFNVYLAGALTFKDDNTQALLADSEFDHLNMSNETVQMIMEAYFKQ